MSRIFVSFTREGGGGGAERLLKHDWTTEIILTFCQWLSQNNDNVEWIWDKNLETLWCLTEIATKTQQYNLHICYTVLMHILLILQCLPCWLWWHIPSLWPNHVVKTGWNAGNTWSGYTSTEWCCGVGGSRMWQASTKLNKWSIKVYLLGIIYWCTGYKSFL